VQYRRGVLTLAARDLTGLADLEEVRRNWPTWLRGR